MASTSENTQGMRIKNAQDTVLILNSLADFKPLVPEDAPAELTKLISDLKTADQDEALALHYYSLSAIKRKDLIVKGEDGLQKSISPIRSYMQAMYGRQDQQFINLNKIMHQITGFKAGREKKKPDETSNSTSQRSYASVTQAFSDLLAILGALQPAYNPPNESISLPKLQEKYQQITELNTAVTNSFNTLGDARQKRNSLDAELSTRLKRIKKSVQSQYGNNSPEYAKLKGYRF